MAGKFHDQNAVRNNDADHHDYSHQRHNVEGRPGDQEEQKHSCKSGGNREQDDEGVLPRRELRHQDQIDKHYGKNQSDPKALERGAHTLHRPSQVYANALGKAGLLEDVLDLGGDAAEVLGLRRNVDVDYAEQLVMIHLGGGRNGSQLDDGVEESRLYALHAPQRDLLEVDHALDLILGILHGQHVGIPVFRIDPIVGCDHAVGSESGDHVVYDFFLRKAEEAGLLSVHVQLQRGVINVLRNEDVAYGLQRAHRLGNFLRYAIDFVEVVPADLNVDGGGQSKINHRIHKAPGLKIGAELWQLLAQLLAHSPHIFIAADSMALFEADLDKRGVGSGVRSVNGGEIRRDADVRNDDLQFIFRHYRTNDLFDTVYVVLGQLHARSRGRFQIDDELTGIGAREKRNAEKGIERESQQRNPHESGQRGDWF